MLTPDVTGKMVLVDSGSVLRSSTTSDVIAFITSVYVSVTCCQHAQMFLSLFHTYGATGATPMLPVYTHMRLHRLGVHPVNHYQLSLKCHSKDHQNAHKHVLSKVGA